MKLCIISGFFMPKAGFDSGAGCRVTPDPVGTGNDEVGGHLEKQAVFYDTRTAFKSLGQFRSCVDRPEAAV